MNMKSLVLAYSLTLLFCSLIWSAEAPVKGETAETAAESKARLLKIFSGMEPPNSLDDLKNMQHHVTQLTDKLQAATVGVRIGDAWGSGVIISKEGYILTAAHVAGKPNLPIEVFMFKPKAEAGKQLERLPGVTLGLNRTIDAGMMRITKQGEYPFVELGDSTQVKIGQWCVSMGHPGGLYPERGLVMRLGRVRMSDDEAIQSDCTLVGGDSGGPLFDMHGRVIGINSRIAGDIIANLHVPANTFRDTWDRLVKADAWGHFPGHEPWLGLQGEKDAKNALVANVKKGSPAEKAGLLKGDIILKFGEHDITDFPSLTEKVLLYQPDDKITVKLQRGNEIKQIVITLMSQSNRN